MAGLSIQDHRRDLAGLKYVYPVLSRRAGGLSIGINVNTNNACNWRCLYCQVPALVLGGAPPVDFELLEAELRWFLEQVNNGAFYKQFQVAPEHQVIKDIALSGNGEPTSIKEFERLIDLIGRVAQASALLPSIKLVIISNGSLLHLPGVQAGLKHFNKLGGKLWFKLDSAVPERRKVINNSRQSQQQLLRKLHLALELCTTKIQTCIFKYRGQSWSATEFVEYLALLAQLQASGYQPDIMLYTLARPSLQPEAAELSALSREEMQVFADEIARMGFKVSVSV